MTMPGNPKEFPDRPKHPDFERLSEIIRNMDAQPQKDSRRRAAARAAGRESEPFDLFFHTIDGDSLGYMAKGRVDLGLKLQREGYMPNNDAHQFMEALWIEAFVAGVRFQQEGGHRDR